MVGNEYSLKNHPLVDFLKLCRASDNPILAERIVRRCKKGGICAEEVMKLARSLRDAAPADSVSRIAEAFPEAAGDPEQFLPLARRFDSNERLLRFLTLGSAVDDADIGAENVMLMTLHAAKGLEFKCVFIAGCEDGILPYTLFEEDDGDIEEERRLLYVGMTRAQRFLYLSNAVHRTLFGRRLKLRRSPFVDKIEKDLVSMERAERRRKRKKDRDEEGEQLTFF